MIRRLKKVTSQAELQQLIETGIIVSPYIAFDSSSNVTNMVLPAEREISEIEYEQESNLPIRLVSAIEPDYSTEEGFTVCSLDFTINAEQVAECDELFLLLCRKSYFDNALANSETSKETLITTYLMDAYNGDDKTLDFSQVFAVNFRNFSFGEDVACKSESYNLAQDDMMFVPYNNTYPNDNTYYLFAGYVYAGDFVSDLVYELAQYRVMPYLSNNAEFVQLGMNVAGTQRGNCVDIDIRVPGNTLYDRIKYAWYLEGESAQDALAEGRTAVCDATTTFFMSDHTAPEYVNETDQELTGFLGVILFNSVTGLSSAPTQFAMMMVEPSGGDEPVWNSPQLVPNMYTTDSSNGEYTDASGNFDIYYAEDEREGWKYVENLNFYLNSQYLEGWGSTAETIETESVGGSNTPLVFITEKNELDAAVEYWSNLSGYSESKTLSYLVYEIMNESREIRYNDLGGNTRTWLTELPDGAETSFWGEDIEYSLYGSQSLQGYYMQTNNDEGKTPEYYILVAYQKEDEPLKASNENILRAAIDTESMYKVYKAGIFRAYDYSEEGDDTPDVSLGYKFSVGANNGGYFNTGYVPGADTVVQLKGKIINDGGSAHGIKGNYSDWMYRIFGNEGDVYFDRMDDQVRITAAVNDIENTSHEYEFGNYYIKVDGVTEATDSESDLSNFYTEISLLVFATSQIGAMGETILDTLAAPGTEVEYFKILEPDGNGGLNLEMDLRPALDASGNICLYDQVAGDIIYPEGSTVNIVATAISGNEPGPDSSSGDSSTGEGPTLTFSSTDLTYNTVADFVPVISGDDSYYDSVAFFVIPDSTVADLLDEHDGWNIGDAVWSLVENEDTRSVGLDSSSGDTVDLSGILNTYYDNQEVYVVALLEHYEVGEYPVYYQPDGGNFAFIIFYWGEPAAEEPEEPEEEPEE